MSYVLCLSFAAIVGVPTAAMVGVSIAAMVGVSTNHHCRQLIVKKVVGEDTDHGFGTGFVVAFLTYFDPCSRPVSAMMLTNKKAG